VTGDRRRLLAMLEVQNTSFSDVDPGLTFSLSGCIRHCSTHLPRCSDAAMPCLNDLVILKNWSGMSFKHLDLGGILTHSEYACIEQYRQPEPASSWSWSSASASNSEWRLGRRAATPLS
jgi:hypothetical protein